ncbi:MAG TPA: SDR family oxidoreductase [Pseudomonadales bacterium]|nr:SDR family oxidoreductase [Pseudomonadales bacterium]
MSSFEGKVAVVTGGAGHIGSAIVKNLLSHGAKVVYCGRRAPDVALFVGDNEAVFVAADIRDASQSQLVIDTAVARFGRLDILINNAGGSPPVAAAEASASFTDKIIQLNLVAPMVMSQQAYHAMLKNESVGSIVNISSVSAVRSSPGTAAYGAAKAGLLNATESLAMEWGPKVRVNALIVGLVHHDAGVEHYGGEEGFKRVANMLPMKRMAQPSDIADAVNFLCSNQAAYISGAALAVHGGGEVPVFLHLAEQASR